MTEHQPGHCGKLFQTEDSSEIIQLGMIILVQHGKLQIFYKFHLKTFF
jgi:hypothetical protein